MPRLRATNAEAATGKVKELFVGVQKTLGMLPNVIRTMASAPAVLEGYLQLSRALSEGALSAKVREQIALSVAEANGCDYCLAAHSAIGRMMGLTADQIGDSRRGTAVDPKTDALIHFARKVVDARGRVSNGDLMQVRGAGFDDGAIAEVVAAVALHTFTNYFNIVAETDIDFPKAVPLQHGATSEREAASTV